MIRSGRSRGWVVILAAGLLVGSCADKGNEPEPPSYRVYVAMNGQAPTFEGYIFVIDGTSDSVIDSIGYEFPSEILWVTASPDGRFISAHPQGPPPVWDASTGALIATLPHQFASVLFLPEEGIVLGTRSDSTYVYSTPAFERGVAYPIEAINAVRVAGTSTVVGLYYPAQTGGYAPAGLLILDFSDGQVLDTLDLDPLGDGSESDVLRFVMSPDGSRLYALTGDRAGTALTGFDLREKRVIFRFPYDASGGLGHCRVTPDGREVWLTHGANPFLLPWPQHLTIVNAFTGDLLETIPVGSDVLEWPVPVSPWDIRFSPDGSKAYVVCGMHFTGAQPLIIIDAKRREILKVLFDDASRIPSGLDIAPNP